MVCHNSCLRVPKIKSSHLGQKNSPQETPFALTPLQPSWHGYRFSLARACSAVSQDSTVMMNAPCRQNGSRDKEGNMTGLSHLETEDCTNAQNTFLSNTPPSWTPTRPTSPTTNVTRHRGADFAFPDLLKLGDARLEVRLEQRISSLFGTTGLVRHGHGTDRVVRFRALVWCVFGASSAKRIASCFCGGREAKEHRGGRRWEKCECGGERRGRPRQGSVVSNSFSRQHKLCCLKMKGYEGPPSHDLQRKKNMPPSDLR